MGFNDNQNKRINNFIVDELRLNPITDAIPKQVIPSIQPIFNVNQKISNIVRSANRTTSGTSTIYTTPTDEDFYLTGISYEVAKDATCDVASGRTGITCVIDGTTQTIISHSALTTTASHQNSVQEFYIPIKVDRGTAISMAFTFTLGSASISGVIKGYTQKTGDVTP